jgi:hypothetical protein
VSSSNGGASPFRRERAYGGLALIGLVIVLALIDAFSAEFTVDPIELALILGSGLVLLGVEAGNKLLGRG